VCEYEPAAQSLLVCTIDDGHGLHDVSYHLSCV
jgi:hypothetical protein